MTPTNKNRKEKQTALRSGNRENHTKIQTYITSPIECENTSIFNFEMHKSNNKNTKFNGYMPGHGSNQELSTKRKI